MVALLGALIFICVIAPPILIEIGYKINDENQRTYNLSQSSYAHYNAQAMKRHSMDDGVIACVIGWLILCAGLVAGLVYASSESYLDWFWITAIGVIAAALNVYILSRNESSV